MIKRICYYHAIGGGFKICEVYLGRKKHKPGFPTLMDKFFQVTQSALEVSRIYKNKLDKVKPIKKYKRIKIFKSKKRPDEKLVAVQLNQFSRDFKNSLSEYNKYLEKELIDKLTQVIIIDRKPEISLTLWVEVLTSFLKLCYGKNFKVKSIPRICRLIAPIFFWRVISFWEEIKQLDPLEIDEKIRSQAKLLRKRLIAE